MPYIIRDASGKITRASARPIHGAEIVQSSHPELVAFVRANGQDPNAIQTAFDELKRTDGDMSRAVEDVVMALLKKNILKMSDLPPPVQDKMAQRVKLRVQIQEAYDQASGQSSTTISNNEALKHI